MDTDEGWHARLVDEAFTHNPYMAECHNHDVPSSKEFFVSVASLKWSLICMRGLPKLHEILKLNRKCRVAVCLHSSDARIQHWRMCVSCPALGPYSCCLLPILGGDDDGSCRWLPSTPAGDLHWGLSRTLWSGSLLALSGIWKVNQGIKVLSLFL